MKLHDVFEEFSEPMYTVKRKANDEFEVAKFTDKKHPDVVYKVYKGGTNMFQTDSPAYFKMGQAEKHIKLVKRFIRDGEPGLTAYKLDTSGAITMHRFGKGDASSEMVGGSTTDAGRFPS